MTPLLELQQVGKTFEGRGWRNRSAVHAVRDVSFALAEGETVGLVGESGSGKTTIARMVMRIETPSAGRLLFRGQDVATMDAAAAAAFRRSVQVIFQDPTASLNPRRRVRRILERPFLLHGGLSRGTALDRAVLDLLAEVGLSPPEQFADRYPHEMSGGQRQRVAIARAIATRPALIVADEPVSSLDVSVRAQILNLMKDLQLRYGLAYLFITHDLATLRSLAHRVAVLRRGELVELGLTAQVLEQPAHAYTAALLDAVPLPDPEAARRRRAVRLGLNADAQVAASD